MQHMIFVLLGDVITQQNIIVLAWVLSILRCLAPTVIMWVLRQAGHLAVDTVDVCCMSMVIVFT